MTLIKTNEIMSDAYAYLRGRLTPYRRIDYRTIEVETFSALETSNVEASLNDLGLVAKSRSSNWKRVLTVYVIPNK